MHDKLGLVIPWHGEFLHLAHIAADNAVVRHEVFPFAISIDTGSNVADSHKMHFFGDGIQARDSCRGAARGARRGGRRRRRGGGRRGGGTGERAGGGGRGGGGGGAGARAGSHQ